MSGAAAGIPWRVIKLGGSLLDLPDVASRLSRWLAGEPAARDCILVGGGRLADVVREADQRFSLAEEASHWLCVRAMGIHAELLASLLPGTSLVGSLPELLERQPASGPAVLDPEHFLRLEEPRLPPPHLPASWKVTSDSIAARLARALPAGELVLLKSCLPDAPCTIEAAARAGYVDEFFPSAAVLPTPIRCVNLRHDAFEQVWLRD